MTTKPYPPTTTLSVTPELAKKRGFPFFKLLVGFCIMLVLAALLLPHGRDARAAARRAHCKTNLRQIVLALYNYEERYGALPPAYIVDPQGRPLHSWRTLILPYLEQEPLYKKIDLSKPWNDPANSDAYNTVPAIYRCTSATLPPNYTSYLGSVGENACFHPTEPRAISEIIDGTTNTLIVFEVAEENAVHWMAPLDASEDMVLKFGKNGKLAHPGGTQLALADGSVRFISADMPPATLHALISIAGNDHVGEY